MARGDAYYTTQKIQAGLKLLGYDPGKIDGAAGRDTNAQIARFLRENNITDTDPRDAAEVLVKIRQKIMADPGVNERLTKMAQNPAALNPEGLKTLQGGMALLNVRTGPGADRVVINGRMGAQTAEASAKFSAAAPLNSSQVKLLQGGLALLGYDSGDVDGKVGKSTKAALDRFAAERNLKPGEDVLKAVQDAVRSSADARESLHAIANAQNPSVNSIMRLQAGLTLMGQATHIDGSIGPETAGNFRKWAGVNPAPRTQEQFRENGTSITRDTSPQEPRPEPARAASIDDDLSLRVRQSIVLQTMPLAAAAAGVPLAFMQGLWGRESSFGKNRRSESHCFGDWQFEKKTFSGLHRNHGVEIPQRIESDGFDEKARTLRQSAFSRGSFNYDPEDPNHIQFQRLRDDPLISTYSAAYLLREKSRSLGIGNIQDPKNWGKLYAAYNIGESQAGDLSGKFSNLRILPAFAELKEQLGKDRLDDADREKIRATLGSSERSLESDWSDFKSLYKSVYPKGDRSEGNSAFFKGGATGAEALRNYADDIEKNIRAFGREFPAQAQSRVEPVSFAKSVVGETGKPLSSKPAFREATAYPVSDDRIPAKPRLEFIKAAGQEMVKPAEQPKLLSGTAPTLAI